MIQNIAISGKDDEIYARFVEIKHPVSGVSGVNVDISRQDVENTQGLLKASGLEHFARECCYLWQGNVKDTLDLLNLRKYLLAGRR